MSFEMARGLMVHLFAISVFLQGLELLKLWRLTEARRVWDGEILRSEMTGFPLANWLLKEETPRTLAFVEMALAAALFIHPALVLIVLLFLVHLAICIRFRGSLNGGSDAMTVVILTGLMLSYSGLPKAFSQLGLMYVGIHLLLSYLRAGIAKLRTEDWRNGRALPLFLAQSHYRDIRRLSSWLNDRTALSFWLCWLVIAFEIGLVSSIGLHSVVGVIFSCVVLFHFAIFIAFGLNRFFWIWISAWPSIFYIASRVASV